MAIDLLISKFGLPALGLAAGLEGEASAMLGGVLAHEGVFALSHAIAAVALGSFLVDQTLFSLGRWSRRSGWVRARLEKHGSQRVFRLIGRHPNLLIMGCRFAYGFRTIVPLAIGASTLPRLRFTLFNAMAAMIWATIFVEIGDHAGGLAEALLHQVQNDCLPVLAVLLVLALGGATAFHLIHRRAERSGV